MLTLSFSSCTACRADDWRVSAAAAAAVAAAAADAVAAGAGLGAGAGAGAGASSARACAASSTFSLNSASRFASSPFSSDSLRVFGLAYLQ